MQLVHSCHTVSGKQVHNSAAYWMLLINRKYCITLEHYEPDCLHRCNGKLNMCLVCTVIIKMASNLS